MPKKRTVAQTQDISRIPTELAMFNSKASAPPLPTNAFKHDLQHIAQNIGQQLDKVHIAAVYGQINYNQASTSRSPATLQLSAGFEQLIHKTQQQFLKRQQYHAAIQNSEQPTIAIELLSLPQNVNRSCCANEPNMVKDRTDNNEQDSQNNPQNPIHNHDHVLPIDLDEAVHGAYAVAQQAIKANNKSRHDSINEPTDTPLHALGSEAIPVGVADVAVNLATAGVMVPLAALAIKAGIHEIQQANQLEQHLQHKKQLHLEQLNAKHLSHAQRNATQNTVNLVENSIKDNHLAKKVGLSSLSSGVAIALKGILDIGITIGTGIKGALTAAGFFNGATVLTNSATSLSVLGGLSLVGNIVLAPLTGAFATALGWFITQKTRFQLRHQKIDGGGANIWLKQWLTQKTIQQEDVTESQKVYQKFIERQHLKRTHFFKRFKKWNQTFLIGSGLYTASAVTKAVVLGVTLGGIGFALSTPTGWALLGIGLAGALIMGIGSIAFLRGHDKQSRYANHRHTNHPDIDRHCLAAASLIDTEKTLTSAAKTLEYLDGKKDFLKCILKKSAEFSGTFEPGNTQRSWLNKLRKRWLTRDNVQQFLETEAGVRLLKNEFQNLLNKKTAHLESKLTLQETLNKDLLQQLEENKAAFTEIEPPFAEIEHENEKFSQLKTVIQRCTDRDLSHNKDQSQLENTRALILQLNNQNFENLPWNLLAAELNLNNNIGNAQAFVKHLLKDCKKDIKHARGILYETHIEMYTAHNLMMH